ncbi:ACP S-malonyltransferase [Candidatus Poriferisodalis sp.]|uniref:ACP S-malonyltransferase n=1 Tax=Candidatus Poriferisodalis sp. TaxID=3101277 RepID=UPI003B01499C
MLAFTFPGQGSQQPGMGAAWTSHASWELVAEASDACGRDVAALLLEAEADELRHTRNSQLSTFVLSMVVLDAVERTGATFDCAAGHSLGEYSALTATGALAYDDAVRLVAERGEAMQVAADEQHGTMAAVLGLDDDLVAEACDATLGDVWVANYNAPGQVVIAGAPDAVAVAGDEAKAAGAKRLMALPVGGAFHTPYMAPAKERLRKALAEVEIRAPSVPVAANVDACLRSDADEWRTLLAQQLTSPVLWRASMHALADAGVATFVELGPGRVLTGMTRRIHRDATSVSVTAPAEIDQLMEMLAKDAPTAPTAPIVLGGENLYVTERLIVSPCAGIFALSPDIGNGQHIGVGDVVGYVAGEEVRSSFAGTVMGIMAAEGERVTARQPVAWLRTSSVG